ncbi:D-glycerate dehydrogenase [candidate division WOR-3 bacterium]|uniref:D-glycerate dehydrogenase n=1 Tax=candidate division WOR-3 bacterium TaxID=2052148 RepID=A0A9D5KBY0_UNCW3|nr:D-glycerate dehydrogenase [candidate division WOR-3 bacterium]MBD3365359.1 D-glycerate dehydrogenase [candidate division WOR-3 bacterium]
MKIYVTRQIPQAGIEPLGEHEVEIYEGDTPIGHQELIEKVRGADAVIPLLTDELDADVLGYAKKLKVVANYAVGYDNIDIEEATERGIVVTNTPDVLTQATAELAWALLFASARRIGEGERLVRQGKFKGWSPTLLLGQGIRGKTLGVVGAGRIGTRFALISRGFEMKVFYYDEERNEELERELGAKKVDISYLLHACDYVSIHLPLTRFTRHLIDAHQIFRMKPTAVLVNTSRGAIIDEKALAAALRGGKLAAAGLDVYENEPEVAPELLKCDNAVLAPHIGSATHEARSRMAELCANAVLDVFAGRMPSNIVNAQVWADRRQ